MKKKLVALLLVSLLALSLLPLTSLRAEATTPMLQPGCRNVVVELWEPTALVNNQKAQIDSGNTKVVPFKRNGRTMLPLRFCASAMGGKTNYLSDKAYITVRVGALTARFKIGSKSMQIVNAKGKVSKTIKLDVAPLKYNGRVMVPVRAISEGLGFTVFYSWHAGKEMVVVSEEKLSWTMNHTQMAHLLDLRKETHINSGKTYSITLKRSWGPLSRNSTTHSFANFLYYHGSMADRIAATPLSKSDIKKYKNITRDQLEKMFRAESSDAEITFYKRTKINGQDVLMFTRHNTDNEPEMPFLWHYCYYFSANAGVEVTYLSALPSSITDFNFLWNNVKLLK